MLPDGMILQGRYRIDTLLGQGGMGAVYRARDTNLNITVVVKENLIQSEESQRQFTREAAMLAMLRHPNLPRVTDHFVISGQGQYLVMDFVGGQNLHEIVSSQGPVPENQALIWIRQVLDALSYLHAQHIIHRDVKPANIKITPEGQAVLVDFGIAKVYDAHLKTTIGARAVTPGFSPPEQYGGSTDARSDIYALGATMYHLLTGQRPPPSVQRMVGEATLAPVRQFNSSVSPAVERAVEKATDISTSRRFQTVEQLRAALEQRAQLSARGRTRSPSRSMASPPVERPVSRSAARSRPVHKASLWLGWVVVTIVGGGLAHLGSAWFGEVVGSAMEGWIDGFALEVVTRTMGWILIGLLTGTLQWLVLRRWIPRAGWWIVATLLAWIILGAIKWSFDGPIERWLFRWAEYLELEGWWRLGPWFGIVVPVVLESVTGFVLGIVQWPALRTGARRAFFWFPASVMAWAGGGAVVGWLFWAMGEPSGEIVFWLPMVYHLAPALVLATVLVMLIPGRGQEETVWVP